MTIDADCIQWGYKILKNEDLEDWRIEWTPDENGNSEGIALFKTKTICIHWPVCDPDYPLMLHEIAHAVTGEDHGHDSFFAHAYMRLVSKYFIPLSEVDTVMNYDNERADDCLRRARRHERGEVHVGNGECASDHKLLPFDQFAVPFPHRFINQARAAENLISIQPMESRMTPEVMKIIMENQLKEEEEGEDASQ